MLNKLIDISEHELLQQQKQEMELLFHTIQDSKTRQQLIYMMKIIASKDRNDNFQYINKIIPAILKIESTVLKDKMIELIESFSN